MTARLAGLGVAVAAALVLGGCDRSDPPAPAPATPQATSAPVATMPGASLSNTLIAHRGGADRHPEASMQAYRAAAEEGFPLEVDLRVLADGSLVPLHDPTVDRTMTGAGPARSLTAAQWRSLRIDVGPGPAVPPTLWNDVLSTFGGRSLLVVEVKEVNALEPFIDSVRARNLQKAVIAQSFRREDVQATARAGIPSMLLSNHVTDFAALKQEGIAYLGCSLRTESRGAYIARARAAGLEVAVYTVNDRQLAKEVFAEGASAVFTDDPWLMAGRTS